VTIGIFSEEDYDFPAAQAALVPGGPARPPLALWRRVLYGIVGVVLGLSGGLGNALVAVNLPNLLGSLGAETNEIAWIPTVYAMTYVSMNLLFVRFRQQFGLRLFAMGALTFFCVVTFLHIFVRGFGSAILIHAAAGVATAPFTTLSVYYLMAALPPKVVYRGVLFGLGISQIPTPLARVFSSELLAIQQWRSLYEFELGLGLICLGCVALLRLPASKKGKVFEQLDLVTYPLIAGGLALVSAVLGLGRYEWWTDRAWLAWASVGAVLLLGAGCYIETNRARPLLDLRWLTGPNLIRFTIVTLVWRIALAEQSTTVIGLLTTLGVDNDELQLFSLALVAASVAGVLASGYLFTPNRITALGALAIGLIAIGAFVDAHATNLTRTPQLYVSQMLIAFSTTLFIGPALLFGISFVLREQARTLPSFLVLFVILQTIGGQLGSALLGTFQVIREKAASVVLYAFVDPTNPIVADRLGGTAAALGGSVLDPAARSAQALALLHQQAAREANVIAFNDTCMLVAALAAATTLYLAWTIFNHWRRQEPLSSAAMPAPERKP